MFYIIYMDKLKDLPNIKTDFELNNRIYKRNVPLHDPQMYYQMRSVDTRFELFPSYDHRKPINEPLKNVTHFDTKRNFLPGNGGPFEGYTHKVNDESKLRNITFSTQTGCQSKYIPSSVSDLYVVNVAGSSNKLENKHPLLFEKQNFTNYNLNPYNLGNNTFFNHTRQQVKNIDNNESN